MHFAQTEMLNWFWIVILGVLFVSWAINARRQTLNKFVQAHLLPELVGHYSFKKQLWKYILLLFMVIFSIFALMRPQFGFEWQEVKRQGLDILVVVDTSKSMLTQDVKPNRLERTKLAVKDLLKKLQGDRIGLIAFAGNAFLLCPLTVDYDGFLFSLNDLSTTSIPRGGTNLSKAIREAIKGYDKTPSQYKAIIIITDGEDLEGDPLMAAREAKERGIKIYCIGIGTKEGELIQIKDEGEQLTFLKDHQGNFVKSRLNGKLLQEIALTTGGVYVKASGAEFGLDLIYERDLSRLEKRNIESKMEKKFHERFQYPLALALFFLVMETCLSTRTKKQ